MTIKRYYNIHFIDGYGRPEYNCYYDADLSDLEFQDHWLFVYLKQSGKDFKLMTNDEAMILSIPASRIIRVQVVKATEDEILKRRKV